MGRTRKNIIENNFNKENLNEKTNKTSDTEPQENIIEICNLKKKEKMLYDVVNDFFNKCHQEELKKITSIIEGKYKISLRFLDWFVTRYCYLYKTSIIINNIYNKENDFNINISYKAQLKSFKKKCFDPFKRKNKFYYSLGESNLILNNSLLTTLGQLNFFKWALSFDIINYVENNFEAINSKITYVNSFFKKNIIDTIDTTETIDSSLSSIISLEEQKSKQTYFDSEIINSLEDNLYLKNLNIENKKLGQHNKVIYCNPIVSRNIFVEL